MWRTDEECERRSNKRGWFSGLYLRGWFSRCYIRGWFSWCYLRGWFSWCYLRDWFSWCYIKGWFSWWCYLRGCFSLSYLRGWFSWCYRRGFKIQSIISIRPCRYIPNNQKHHISKLWSALKNFLTCSKHDTRINTNIIRGGWQPLYLFSISFFFSFFLYLSLLSLSLTLIYVSKYESNKNCMIYFIV